MVDKIAGSFRDPSGFLFTDGDQLFRQVNLSYKEDYDQLMESGLYDRLTKSRTMVSHEEVKNTISPNLENAYKVIKPEVIDFISYPYEWCFSQLKEAALLTLAIAKRSLDYGMSLKDASAYNVQFQNGHAIFIDTLSVETFKEGKPWVAYRQFCQHFLAPLALMVYHDVRLNQLMRVNIDGIPLDMVSSLLPFKTRLNLGLLTHIHLHSKSQKRYADKPINSQMKNAQVSKQAIIGLLESLISTVKRLSVPDIKTEWTDYYSDTNYSSDAFSTKKELIKSFLANINPNLVWDLGANTGEFSKVASKQGVMTVAFDIDPGAVDQSYRIVKEKKEKNILPLIMDLINPSPALGWHHQERSSLINRGPADLIFALALVHHLAIGNNVPLESIANFFSDVGKNVIVEFIPKSDSQVQKLLSSREDIFDHYTLEDFETAFSKYFKIIQKEAIRGSQRTIYLMERNTR